MRSHDFGRLGVEFDFFVYTNVDLCKVIFIKIRLQYTIIFYNTLLFQFVFSSEYIPCRVQLLVLIADGFALLITLGSQIADICIQIIDGFV